MVTIAALYRHPLKRFTPEALTHADLETGGWFPGDRLWAVEHGESGHDPFNPGHIAKTRFIVLARHAAIAGIRTNWNETDGTLAVVPDDVAAFIVRPDDPADRRRLERYLTERLGDTVTGPLRMIDAGPRHRFMDSPKGRVSILNLASVRDFETRLGRPIDPLRFRANVWVEGWPAWIENEDMPPLHVGGVRLASEKPIVRCAATEVNPQTAERDLEVVKSLFNQYGHVLCGLYASIETGGRIAVGDAVTRQP